MNLLLIGCGNIGGTLLKLWGALPLLNHIVVVQPSMSHAKDYAQLKNVEFVASIDSIPANFVADITVLAIKPQLLTAVATLLKARPASLVISLLAAITVDQLIACLPVNAKVVRVMPNIAIKTGNSVNLIFALNNLEPAEHACVETIMAPAGQNIWLPLEKDLDLLAPISGCGPAYFLLLAEYLVAEAVRLGIDQDMAAKIVQQTFIGSASLITMNTDYAGLIDSVTSKKGVTEAALQKLRPGLLRTLSAAITAALTRSQEIQNENSR